MHSMQQPLEVNKRAATGSAGGFSRREGNLDGVQAVSDASSAWRAFACMVPFTASDSTPLLMLYGGTSNGSAKDPLNVAENGAGGIRVFDTNNSKWYAPNKTNAPKTGPILPGCGASPGIIWVYDPQYGVADKASTAVGLLDSVHWSWSSPTEQGQLPVTRFGAAFAYASSTQKFYMHGGIPLNGDSNTAATPPGIANNLDILAPSTLSWDYASNGPGRKYHTLCYMSSIDSIVLFGGSDQNTASYNDVKLFSIKKNVWDYNVVPSGPSPAERILHSAVCTEDTMYVFGGLHSINDAPSDSAVWMLKANSASSFTWSRASISSSSQGTGPTARAGHAAAVFNNNMYIYGGIGSSGQDSMMYKLDLAKLEWSKTTASGSGSDSGSGGSGGTSTRVLIAAIVSSVLGVICIGIAAVVFYRWNRRRGVVRRLPATSAACVSGDDHGGAGRASSVSAVRGPNTLSASYYDERKESLGNKDTYGQSMAERALHDASTYRGQATRDYSLQYENPEYFRLGSSGSTAVHHRNPSEIIASNYLPSPHANPSLESSITSFISPLHSGPVAGSTSNGDLSVRGNGTPDTARNSIATLDTPERRSSKTVSPQNLHGASTRAGTHSPAGLPSPPNHAEVINDILLSGRPIPAWLRDAVSRAASAEQEDTRPGLDSQQESPSLMSGPAMPDMLTVRNPNDTRGAGRGENNCSSSSSNGNAGSQPGSRLAAVRETEKHTAAPSRRTSIHSDITNDTQSALLGEPIRYIETSLESTEGSIVTHGAEHESGAAAQPVDSTASDWRNARQSSPRRRESDLSDSNFGYGRMDTPLGWPSFEPIARPMAPPVPPHMNSLYGELEHSGIVVGQANIPAPSVAAGRVATQVTDPRPAARVAQLSSANGSGTPIQDTILSPLDRLAQYHNLDAWMGSSVPGHRESCESESAASDDTSQIYAALPVRRSPDSY